MFNRWSTLSDQGELVFFENIKEPTYNPEIENYTDYYFSTSQKIDTITAGLQDEANKTWQNIDSVFTNIGDGISNASTALKYLPLMALAAGGYILLKKTKAI